MFKKPGGKKQTVAPSKMLEQRFFMADRRLSGQHQPPIPRSTGRESSDFIYHTGSDWFLQAEARGSQPAQSNHKRYIFFTEEQYVY